MADDYDDDERQLVLGDLLNRVLDKGLVVAGSVTISVANIDLVRLDLTVVLTSVETALRRGLGAHVSAQGDADLPVLPSRARR
ncbi:MAG: hypothetical protein NVS9B3_06730 [Gemmatimonadaceae bacterium]